MTALLDDAIAAIQDGINGCSLIPLTMGGSFRIAIYNIGKYSRTKISSKVSWIQRNQRVAGSVRTIAGTMIFTIVEAITWGAYDDGR